MAEEAVSSAAASPAPAPAPAPAPTPASLAGDDNDVGGDSLPAGNNDGDDDDSHIPFSAAPPPHDDDDDDDPLVDPSKKSLTSPAQTSPQLANPSPSSSSSRRIDFVDHFSLGRPSSSIRFRKQRVQMYDLNNQQQILLKQQHQQNDDDNNNKQGNNNNNNTILVQRFETASMGSRFLRLSYSIVTLLMLCFLFAFCLQVIIFLFLNMASTPSGEIKVGYIIAVALSIPLFLYGMASLMALGAAFLRDTFMGNPLFRQIVGGIRPIIMESICLIFFVVVPGLTAAITLLSKIDIWWEITAWTWIVCDLIFFSAFSLCVVFCEVKTTIELITILLQQQQDNNSDDQQHQPLTVERVLKESILITQTMCYSGYRKQQYLIDTRGNKCLIKSTESLYARLTQLSCWANKQQQQQNDDNDEGNNNEPVSSPSPSGAGKVFQIFDPPVRSYEPDEIRDRLPFLGSLNWSLEQVFCRDPNAAAVFVQQGPGALRHSQVVCTLVCTVAGAVLVVLLLAGVMVYMDVGVVGAILFPLFVIGCCVLPIIVPWIRLYKLYGTPQEENRRQELANGGKQQSIMMAFRKTEKDNDIEEASLAEGNNDGDDDTGECGRNEDETVFQISETVRISQPNLWFCWCAFAFSIIVFFLWPMIDLFARGNIPIAIVYIVFGIFSGPRLYLNPTPILRQLGSLSNVDLPVNDVAVVHEGRDTTTTAMRNENTGSPTEGIQHHTSAVSSSPSIVVNQMLLIDTEAKQEVLLRKRARLSRIVGDLNNRARTACWMWTFGFLMGIVGVFVLSAFYQTSIGFDYRVKFEYDSFADGFYYPPQPRLPYPTCRMGKDFDFGDNEEGTQLMDIAFLATMGFAGPDEAGGLLDQWFGEGFVVDEYEFVDEYRAGLEARGISDTKISFKLFTLPSVPGLGVVSIRGSESLLDWCIDVQLWLGAGLAQIIRSIVPVGWVFTPILDDLVFLINSVQSNSLKEVAYYKTTTQFINDMLDGYADGRFTTMRVTGASLGGGLAIITGAQTNSSAVAISGLNAMLSRHTFDPPLSAEALDTHVMNVIPDRDPISHVDDPGRLVQRTACRAPKNSIMGCHSMWRNVCEIAYQCGSNGRPVLCWCVSRYGYPEPIQSGNQTWAEACPPEAQ